MRSRIKQEIRRTGSNLAQIKVDVTPPLLVLQPLLLVWPAGVPEGTDRAWVIGSRSLVFISSRSIPLEVGDGDRGCRFVYRELLKVHAKAMTLCNGVNEQTSLQDRISRWFDALNKVRGRESCLFNLSEVILGVFVEDDFPKLAERIIRILPDLGEIEDIVPVSLCLILSHGLLREQGNVR